MKTGCPNFRPPLFGDDEDVCKIKTGIMQIMDRASGEIRLGSDGQNDKMRSILSQR